MRLWEPQANAFRGCGGWVLQPRSPQPVTDGRGPQHRPAGSPWDWSWLGPPDLEDEMETAVLGWCTLYPARRHSHFKAPCQTEDENLHTRVPELWWRRQTKANFSSFDISESSWGFHNQAVSSWKRAGWSDFPLFKPVPWQGRAPQSQAWVCVSVFSKRKEISQLGNFTARPSAITESASVSHSAVSDSLQRYGL